jgi:hypothetical protein
MPFFAPKYFTTYIHKTFFEEYTNFEAHIFSRFGVISVRSFGSLIRPQPHGLGLNPHILPPGSEDSLEVKDFLELGGSEHNLGVIKYYCAGFYIKGTLWIIIICIGLSKPFKCEIGVLNWVVRKG